MGERKCQSSRRGRTSYLRDKESKEGEEEVEKECRGNDKFSSRRKRFESCRYKWARRKEKRRKRWAVFWFRVGGRSWFRDWYCGCLLETRLVGGGGEEKARERDG